MDDICIKGKCLSGPKMLIDIAHGEPHVAEHDQSVGVERVRVRRDNRARAPLPLKYFMKAADQRSRLEGLKSHVCDAAFLSILRAWVRIAAVTHRASQEARAGGDLFPVWNGIEADAGHRRHRIPLACRLKRRKRGFCRGDLREFLARTLSPSNLASLPFHDRFEFLAVVGTCFLDDPVLGVGCGL